MIRTRTVTDLDECRVLWNSLGGGRNVSDLWEFRLCFHRHFKNEPSFLVLDDGRGILGVLPLCRLEEQDMFGFFPGEIWQGKTWLERTPVYCRDREALPELLGACPQRTFLRYIEADVNTLPADVELDEIGYLLHPPDFHFSMDEYYRRFSWKKLKAIKKEISSLLVPESSWHVNRPGDYDVMVRMNRDRFGPQSYFHDPRFKEGFRDALSWLHQRGWLRMVSLEIRGNIAAVDLGAVYGGTYVVFLGGTHADFPGVAKVMNMHHIEFAVGQGFGRVDFLCGDFCWKKLWHLDPQPLFKFLSPALKTEFQPEEERIEVMDYVPPAAQLGVSAY
jgi:hypothetical protein